MLLVIFPRKSKLSGVLLAALPLAADHRNTEILQFRIPAMDESSSCEEAAPTCRYAQLFGFWEKSHPCPGISEDDDTHFWVRPV